MGLNAAVELSTLFMSELFGKISKPNVLLRFFYIDDIFMIMYGSREKVDKHLNLYNQQHPKIKINWVISEHSVDFLDLTIKLKNDHIITQTHQKQLNKYLYLPPTSFHPKHTKFGFIKGELIRYARLSSSIDLFNETKTHFRARLISR